jgi:hypothetical protein
MWDKQAKEPFVKITPKKCLYRSSFNSPEEYEKYYTNICNSIKSNIDDHFKDYDIESVEIEDNNDILELQDKLENIESFLYSLMLDITDASKSCDDYLLMKDWSKQISNFLYPNNKDK